LQVGAGTDTGDVITVSTSDATSATLGVNKVTTGDHAAFQTLIDEVDDAVDTLNTSRATLGATLNRFTSVIENLATTSNNLSAARSRIEDADYAVEVSNMTRAQILQQAGTSVLAQANQVPQGVLSLLR